MYRIPNKQDYQIGSKESNPGESAPKQDANSDVELERFTCRSRKPEPF